jgi:hypothetical protein
LGSYPWAAGTKGVPLPRLLNVDPFGVQNPSLDFLTPGVQSKKWVKIRLIDTSRTSLRDVRGLKRN